MWPHQLTLRQFNQSQQSSIHSTWPSILLSQSSPSNLWWCLCVVVCRLSDKLAKPESKLHCGLVINIPNKIPRRIPIAAKKLVPHTIHNKENQSLFVIRQICLARGWVRNIETSLCKILLSIFLASVLLVPITMEFFAFINSVFASFITKAMSKDT